MEQPSEWNGMILHLFRQVDSSVHSSNTMKELTGGEIHTYTAFGNYDRLCFTPVCRFVDYMKRSENAYRWIGGHKDIMLYPVRKSDAERHFSFEKKVEKQRILVMKEGCERRFLIMTMLFLSSEVKEQLADYRKLLKACDGKINQLTDKYNKVLEQSEERPVFGELYGTFNSAEMCILWGADQFTDVQYLVDQIRYLTIKEQGKEAIPLFASSYTIISMYQSIPEILNKGPIKGGAMIQLASASLRHTTSVDMSRTPIEYLTSLNESRNGQKCELYEVEACSGEYDFLLNTRPPRLDIFDKSREESLHYKNEYYKAHFSSSTTRLYYDNRDIPESAVAVFKDIDLNIEASRILREYKESEHDDALLFGKEEYDEYYNLLDDSIGDVSSLGTNFRLFYSDYMRAVHMTPDRQWTKDLEYQVKTAIEALTKIAAITESNEFPKKLQIDRQYIEWTEEILQTLRHQIHHITEAGKFTFEEPSLRAHSTVEYDLLFHMFYGAAKEILACIYDRKKGKSPSKQTPLVPVIKFQPTPAIESKLWFEDDRVESRLLDITIPYDAWGEPQFFIPYLVHEFYHYAAPVDRNIRNELFSKFLLCEIYRKAIQEYLCEKYDSYCSLKRDCTEKKISVELERLILVYTDMLQKQIFKIIGSSEVIIRNKMMADNLSEDKQVTDDSPIQKERLQIIEKGDADWNTNKEAFGFWCKCREGESDDPNNCVGFLKEVLIKAIDAVRREKLLDPSDELVVFSDMISAAVGSNCEDNNIRTTEKLVECAQRNTENIIELLNDSLKCLRGQSLSVGNEDDIRPGCYSDFGYNNYPIDVELTKQLIKETENCIHRTNRGLREIFPDYAMVTLCDLGIKEYLLLLAAFQDKCFTTPDQYYHDDDSTLRVGCMLDQLLKKGKKKGKSQSERFEKFTTYRASFVKLYSGYCLYCGWSDFAEKGIRDVSQNANAWFDVFVQRLSDYYATYGVYYEDLFDRVIKDCFSSLCSKTIGKSLSQITRHYFNELNNKNLDKLFESSLEAISLLQPQINLHKMMPHIQGLNGIYAGTPTMTPRDQALPTIRDNIIRWVVKADQMQENLLAIAENLKDIHRECFGMELGTSDLWYRGVWNCEFGILPSAIVHFLDQDLRSHQSEKWEKGKNSIGRLWEYQSHLLEKFKYQADGSPEMLGGIAYTMPDYLALMQHYKQHTCYLDWSEDAFSSLFFALERYVMREDLQSKEEEAHASLFVLDPALYNRARAKMVSRVINNSKKSALKDQNQELLKMQEGSIPDISLNWNLQNCSMFTMGDRNFFTEWDKEIAYVEYSNIISKKKVKKATLKDFESEVLNLPLAVHTSRLNPRIRKQSGQFMVYSYLCRPAYAKHEKEDPKKYVRSVDRFDYLALQRIQDYYLDIFPEEYPFMYELRIHCNVKATIAAFLRSAGINRFGIYPELDNLKL